MRTPLVVATLSLAAVACARAPAVAAPAPAAAAGVPLADAPAALAGPAGKADEAIKALRDRLLARVKAELTAGGPVKTIEVCRAEAPAIAAAVGAEQGVEVGRTSARLRNPANAPRPWVRALVADSAGKKAAEAGPLVFDLGDRVGVARPIGVAGACLSCHGPREVLAPPLTAALTASYPADAAVGYAEGDLRGWFWAEARK